MEAAHMILGWLVRPMRRTALTRQFLGCLLLGLGLTTAVERTAIGQSVADFYKGRTITIAVGFTPGGGYDLNARTVGRHLPKHLPGAPTVVIQNMPGAGSLKSINHLYNIAAKDGTALAVFSRGVPMEPLLGGEGVQFDPLKLNWIGSPSRETNVVFAWHTTPFKTFQDVLDRQMIVSTTGSGADTATFPLLINEIFNSKLKLVTGYPGAAETLIAVERGEAEGMAGLSWGYLKASRGDWIRDKKITMLLQLAPEKALDLADVPLASDLVKNESDRQLLELFLSRLTMAWPFAAPPNVPTDRVEALRAAFDAVMADPEFRADAQRQQVEVDPVSGETIAALLQRIYASPPDVVARARAVVEQGRK